MGPRQGRRRQTLFVGDKIRSLRKERLLTQSGLAQRIGVQQSDLCRMENGEYKVSLEILFKILGVFGMEIGDFFRDPDRMQGAQEQDEEMLRLFHCLDDAARNEVLQYLRFRSSRFGTE